MDRAITKKNRSWEELLSFHTSFTYFFPSKDLDVGYVLPRTFYSSGMLTYLLGTLKIIILLASYNLPSSVISND